MSSTSPAPPRTVPTKLHTAPTRWSASRRRASSTPTSKSACWMVTRPTISTSGDGREEGDLAALAQRRVVLHHHLVQCHAHCAAGGQRLRVRRTAAGQFVAQLAQRSGARLVLLAAAAHGLAHRREVAQLHLHASSSVKGRKRTG